MQRFRTAIRIGLQVTLLAGVLSMTVIASRMHHEAVVMREHLRILSIHTSYLSNLAFVNHAVFQQARQGEDEVGR